eukprot:Partr_v1_DN27432_c0_g1_i1_m71650 putative Solute carrier family 19
MRKSDRYAMAFLLFGVLKAFKPSEPFLTPFLKNNKHIDKEAINNEIYPIWDYAHWLFIPLLALIAETVSYRAVIFLEAAGHMATRLILIFGVGLRWMQAMQVTFALGTAADIVYYAYVFKAFPVDMHQKMNSFSRAAVLLGHCMGSLLGQILVIYGVDLEVLFSISAVSTGAACFAIFFFPSDRDVAEALASDYDIYRGLEVGESDVHGDEEQSLLNDDEKISRPVEREPFGLAALRPLLSGHMLSLITVPLSIYAGALVYLYNVEGYAPSIWLDILTARHVDHDTAKMYNGFADCGARGLAAIGSYLAFVMALKFKDCKNVRNLGLSVALLLMTGLTVAETLVREIFSSYVIYCFAVGVCGFLSTSSSAWLGAVVMELPKFGRAKHALMFGVATFLSSSVKALLQFIMTTANFDIIERFWGFTVFLGAVTLFSIAYSAKGHLLNFVQR